MLYDQLQSDLKSAMKGHQEFELGVLRMLTSAIHNKEIEKKAKSAEGLSDDEIIEVLQKEAKKRREAAALYESGGRADLKEQELKEAEFISKYLPKQMSGEEVEEAVKKIINKLVPEPSRGASNDFGSIMKEAMKELKGKADGKAVGEAVKKLLS